MKKPEAVRIRLLTAVSTAKPFPRMDTGLRKDAVLTSVAVQTSSCKGCVDPVRMAIAVIYQTSDRELCPNHGAVMAAITLRYTALIFSIKYNLNLLIKFIQNN